MRATTSSTFSLLTTAVPNKCGFLHPTFQFGPINLSSYYTYTSPSASGPKVGYISFTLSNDEVDYATQCAGVTSMPLGQFYNYQQFECTSPGQSGAQKSSFTFDSTTKVLSLNSTWNCGGDVVYGTSVYGRTDLQCKTDRWVNQEWKSGELYSNTSTTCQPGLLVIST